MRSPWQRQGPAAGCRVQHSAANAWSTTGHQGQHHDRHDSVKCAVQSSHPTNTDCEFLGRIASVEDHTCQSMLQTQPT